MQHSIVQRLSALRSTQSPAPHRRVRTLFGLTLAVMAGVGAPANAQQFIAQGAGPDADFPDTASYSFEQGATLPWVFSPKAGVRQDGAVPGLTVIDGSWAAYLLEDGTLSTTFTFPAAGTWRLKFMAAPSLATGTPDDTRIEVEVGSALLLGCEPFVEGNIVWHEFVSRPFTLDANDLTQTVVFSGASGANQTAFVDRVLLEPISEWQDPATWGTPAPPGNGDEVLIDAGVEVAMAGDCIAQIVSVAGELLATNRDGSLRGREIVIEGQGARFEVGLEGAPFEHDFAVKLVGTAPPCPLPSASENEKCLIAKDRGQIDMHGSKKTSWTRLTATAEAGATVVHVEDATGWKAGDEVVLAGTNYQNVPTNMPQNYEDEAEKAVIRALSGNTLYLEAPLQHRHHSVLVPVNHNQLPDLEMRAEVGMLSHNVRVRGMNTAESLDELSEHTTCAQESYGGHIMLMGNPGAPELGGRGRFSSVELVNLGQLGRLGRYPMHWHLQVDNGLGQYCVDSSIHNSFNRAITIHATDQVRVERNVAYSHLGHGVFFEDGSEQWNEIHDNLVLSTVRPELAIVPTDVGPNQPQNRAPSSYWISNPLNYFTGNVAAGTIGSGYWLVFPEEPLEASAGIPAIKDRTPLCNPLGSFVDNVAHSCAIAFDVNDSNKPGAPATQDLVSNADWTPPVTAVIDGFVAWACESGIYTGENDAYTPATETEPASELRFDNCLLSDNKRNIDFAGYHLVENAFVLADSGYGIMPPSEDRYAFVLYHNGRVRNSHFEGFDVEPHSFFFNRGAAQRQTNTSFRGISLGPTDDLYIDMSNDGKIECDYTGSPALEHDPREWGIAARDLDGSLTGVTGTVIVDHPFIRTPGVVTMPNVEVPTPCVDLLNTQHTLAHVTILYSGIKNNPGDLHIHRFDPGGSSEFFDYEGDVSRTKDKKKQFPVIADTAASGDEFEYAIDWFHPQLSASGTNWLEVKVDGLDPLGEAPDATFYLPINFAPVNVVAPSSATLDTDPSENCPDSIPENSDPAPSLAELFDPACELEEPSGSCDPQPSRWFFDSTTQVMHLYFTDVKSVEGHILRFEW